MDEVTQDVQAALHIAAELIKAGIPVFAAPPCPAATGGVCDRPGHAGGAHEFDLPPKWQMTVPATVWLERWQPGWALAAVGGHAADFLDEDPRNGGDASVGELHAAGQWPTVFGEATTPSGGRHYLISPVAERKVTGLLPGLDYQGGAPDGQGRGFVWIAPTVKRSKDPADGGASRSYVWTTPPDLEYLAEFGRDPATGSLDSSLDGVRLRIAGYRARRVEKMSEARDRTGSAERTFTPAAMEHFLAGPENALRTAAIGSIEEYANAYACSLSHFVPALLSAEQAYDRLSAALGATAYDPSHPASGWEAEKFLAVIGDIGGRAPADWHASAEVEPSVAMAAAVAAVDPDGDAVTALLAEMLPPAELAGRPAPRYMIKGLLTYDAETWLIGGPGSKKSFVALDMAAHVARGMPWQGRKVNQGVALLIMGEGAGSVGKRIQAWEKEYGPMPADGIRILPRPVQAADLGAWAVLVQACARLRGAIDPALGMFIVVDTQARSTVGLDENDAQGMGVYINALAALREATGGCVMSVHHTTKAGSSTRGSGAQDGAQTSRLLMKSEKGSLVSKLYSDKQKDLEEAEPIELRFHKMDVGLDEDGEPIDSLVLTPASAWTSGLFDGASAAVLERRAEGEITPFTVRVEPENWTHRLLPDSRATLQRWLVQALKDTAAERGLRESDWKKIVEEKRGKLTASTWSRAFNVVTDSAGKAAGDGGVVVKIQGAERWTIDPVAVEAFVTDQ